MIGTSYTNEVTFLIISFRAVLVYPPSLDFTVAFLACLKAGIVAVPVFPPNPLRRDSLQMFAVIVESCGATFALTDQTYNYQTKLMSIKQSITKFRRKTIWPEHLEWIVTDAKSSKKTTKPVQHTPKADDVAFLQFTSGSTSDPKGVMITQGNLAHNLTCITNELKATDDTIVVSWLPQYHDMGLIGSYLGCLYCGGSGYYMSPLSFLQRPMLWMEAVSNYRATHLQAPNFAFKLVARKFQNQTLDLSCVRHIINAAEPVDAESMKVFYDTFGKFGLKKVIYPTYGLAEHTVFVCSGGEQILTVLKKELEVDGRVVEGDESDKTKQIVGCGYPARQKVLVKIVDHEKSEPVADDAVGEIWVRSDSKAAGYYGKMKETKSDFEAVLDGDEGGGFLRTGDLGFLHNSELFICGRLKDLIIIGGRNYYPQDLEGTAEASTDLARLGCSAAFTIDPTGEEEVALVMELKEVPDEVEAVCAKLANEVRSAINQEHSLSIASIAFLKARSVPKTSSGKIARAWCRKGYVDKTLHFIYHKSFKSSGSIEPMEIEQASGAAPVAQRPKKDPATIRAMSKDDIMKSLQTDISRVGSLPVESIEKKAALVSFLDSITIAQFKGMLENHYAVKLSDEYLFRETTTLVKLVEVVKLGYAPDDGEDVPPGLDHHPPGQPTGCAGALGCPPGVVCVIQ